MNQLETLLHRYKEGVITPEEQAELDQLTHRHEVFNAAREQASSIRRRQYSIVSSVASVLIVVGVIVAMWSRQGSAMPDTPLVAQSGEVQIPAVLDTAVPQTPARIQTEAMPNANARMSTEETVVHRETAAVAEPSKSAPARREPTPAVQDIAAAEPSSYSVSEPVVACNTQCSPDSVINDIWNFLKA